MKAQLYRVENQDPITTARKLLQDLWQSAELDGLYIPARKDESLIPEGELFDDPSQLEFADPFAPIMPINQAPFALQALRDHTGRYLGVFLRPCEWRTFQVLISQSGERFDNLFAISADCMGAMDQEEFERLAEGDPRGLTRRALHFASQGGLLPSRQQSSCQLCEDPIPGDVDLQFDFFGVPTDEQLVLNFKDSRVAQAVSVQNAGIEVPKDMVERRTHVLQDLARWRSSSFEKRKAQLGSDMLSIEGLTTHLQSCESCRVALGKYCPTVDLELLTSQSDTAVDQLRDWLMSCSGCGVCDKDCPKEYPLFSVIFSLRNSMDIL
jgi:Pyruvate/2-oxoacid:ferredoxin oxidoreductase delta subunit